MRRILFVLAILLAICGSPAVAKKKPELTPMELQAIQSREFETDKSSAFGAVMTVIQDLGYTVESADLNSGFITAYSPTENKTGFFEALAGVTSSGNTRVTAFIMQMPSKMTRVRLNFLNSKDSSSIYGQSSKKDKPILDAAVYTTAWDKIDEALFVMTALTDPSPSPKAVEGSSGTGDNRVDGETVSASSAALENAKLAVPAAP